eukprot:6363238-Amphidinium_carterae.1
MPHMHSNPLCLKPCHTSVCEAGLALLYPQGELCTCVALSSLDMHWQTGSCIDGTSVCLADNKTQKDCTL